MEQILNDIAAKQPSMGLLEKLFCGNNKVIPYAEGNLYWSIAPIEGDDAASSHTAGQSVPVNARGSDVNISFKAPNYMHKRPVDVDHLYTRVQASAGMDAASATERIFGRDVASLSRDMVASTERQCAKLLTACQLDYKLDTGSFTPVNCYTTSNPCTHSQTILIHSVDESTSKDVYKAQAAIDEMVKACIDKGFMPNAVVLGSTATQDYLDDPAIQALGKNNNWVPELIELSSTDGGSFIGRIGSKWGCTIEVYSCNESTIESGSRTALVTAKGAIMMQVGAGQTLLGAVSVPQDGDGKANFGYRPGVRSYTYVKAGEAEDTIIQASRAVIVPNTHAWIYASAVTA